MMICREIIKEIEARFPKHYAMEWDNVGLQVGRSDKEVKRIYLALDATDEVIEEAADWGADMLITHHPMIFKAMKKINDEDFIGRRVLKLIRDDISYYAMHTNYDVIGMADLSADHAVGRIYKNDCQYTIMPQLKKAARRHSAGSLFGCVVMY